jgi:hypothetical protein
MVIKTVKVDFDESLIRIMGEFCDHSAYDIDYPEVSLCGVDLEVIEYTPDESGRRCPL